MHLWSTSLCLVPSAFLHVQTKLKLKSKSADIWWNLFWNSLLLTHHGACLPCPSHVVRGNAHVHRPQESNCSAEARHPTRSRDWGFHPWPTLSTRLVSFLLNDLSKTHSDWPCKNKGIYMNLWSLTWRVPTCIKLLWGLRQTHVILQ